MAGGMKIQQNHKQETRMIKTGEQRRRTMKMSNQDKSRTTKIQQFKLNQRTRLIKSYF